MIGDTSTLLSMSQVVEVNKGNCKRKEFRVSLKLPRCVPSC